MTKAVALNEFSRIIGQDHPNATHSDREVDMAKTLRSQGLSIKQVADKLEASKSTVAGWLNGRRRNQIPVGWKDGKE